MCSVQLDHVFPNYVIYGTIFGKFIGHKKLLFYVQLLLAIFLTPTRIKWHTVCLSVTNVRRSSNKVPSCLSQFNATTIFSIDFFRNIKIYTFIKILPVRAKLLHANGQTDRQTDMTKLMVAFRNFGKVPKIRRCARQLHFKSSTLPRSQVKKKKAN